MASLTDLHVDFPFEGEMFYPKLQKYKETIVFTHHYGGHKKQLKRHIQYVNDLGFKAYAFNLFPQPFTSSFHLLVKPQLYYKRLGAIWKKQITQSLDQIKGEKIIYSFSFSCNLTTQLAYKHPSIKALILDGGPFAQPIQSSWLYLSHQEIIKNPILRAFLIIPWNIFFNFLILKIKINRSLKLLPTDFPILSFQAMDDLLVPPKFINVILESHDQLHLTKVPLKGTKHLQGLKTQVDLYTKHLREFLDQNSKLI